MPWIAYKIHNINYVIYLMLEKERRSLIGFNALLCYNFIYLYDFLLQLENHFSNYS